MIRTSDAPRPPKTGPALDIASPRTHATGPDTRAQAQERGEFRFVDGISRAYLLHHLVCPIGFSESGALRVATTDDSRECALDDLSLAYRRPIETLHEPVDALELRIERATSALVDPGGFDEPRHEEGLLGADIEDLANQPPVIRYVNLLLREAHEAGASDVHLDSRRDGISARLRLDGRLAPALAPPRGLGAAVVSRIKLLAELDIAERRRPQDGRMRVRAGTGELDLRVSTVPTLNGESVVLRLLSSGRGPVALEDLGMPEAMRTEFANACRRPHGSVLVTGPTGSGKTTTLYSALRLRDLDVEKTLTVEDPVEYEVEGIAQVPVRRATDVTFASALRALLRQDPDVILVGEMRDPETAGTATQAALTGHVVFSTLHTNDALGAIPRLRDLGVPGYLIAATVDGVLGQRLVRRICDSCRISAAPPEHVMGALGEALGSAVDGGARVRRVRGGFARGEGCDACRGTGFRGRTGVFEWLPMVPEIRGAIVAGEGETTIRRLAVRAGYAPMVVDGVRKAREGLTTPEEVLRVTYGA